jgi:hypothetical protein
MRLAVAVALLAVVVTHADGDATSLAPMSPEIAELRSAQATVAQAQKDLDGLDQNVQDSATMAASAQAKGKAAQPDLGEALMKEDDLSVAPAEDTDAAVQAEAMANNVLQAGSAEGEDKADPKDVGKVFDLAKSLKQSDLLPEGWVEKTDASSGKNYYENKLTKTTSWDPPRSLVGIALAAAKGQLKMKQELEEMKSKMESRDLGESANTAVESQCPKKVQELVGDVKKLENTLKSLAQHLNLTGEQQKRLAELMKTVAVPVMPKTPPAKKAKKPAAKKPAAKKPAAKKPAAKKPADPSKPIELGETEALEASDDAKEAHEVEAAMKAEQQNVAKNFASEEAAREKAIEEASLKAGKDMESKMAQQDKALMASDQETDASMHDIVGSAQQLANEQALFAGTMTPDQVNAAVDPEISKMEKGDLGEGLDIEHDDFKDNSFAAIAPHKAVKHDAAAAKKEVEELAEAY